jgi:hypothetical protein
VFSVKPPPDLFRQRRRNKFHLDGRVGVTPAVSAEPPVGFCRQGILRYRGVELSY